MHVLMYVSMSVCLLPSPGACIHVLAYRAIRMYVCMYVPCLFFNMCRIMNRRRVMSIKLRGASELRARRATCIWEGIVYSENALVHHEPTNGVMELHALFAKKKPVNLNLKTPGVPGVIGFARADRRW